MREAGGPLYLRIANDLRQQIDSGAYTPGGALPTIRALGRELKVNERTVSKAYGLLEREGYVHVENCSGVYMGAKDTGCDPALIPTVRNLIGCVVPETIETHVLKVLTRAAVECLQRLGYAVVPMLVINQREVKNRLEHYKGMLSGVLFGVSNAADMLGMAKLASTQGLAVAFAGIGSAPGPEFPYDFARVDDWRGAFDTTNALIRRDHQRIVWISAKHNVKWRGLLRFLGYKEAMRQAGLEPEVAAVRKGCRATTAGLLDCGEEAARGLLAQRGRPTALICESGVLGVGAYHALRDNGITLPDDMELVTCGGEFETDPLFAPDTNPLSIASEPMGEVGAAAAGLLVQRFHQPDLPRQEAVIKSRLIQGRTTRPDASGNNKSQNQ